MFWVDLKGGVLIYVDNKGGMSQLKAITNLKVLLVCFLHKFIAKQKYHFSCKKRAREFMNGLSQLNSLSVLFIADKLFASNSVLRHFGAN